MLTFTLSTALPISATAAECYVRQSALLHYVAAPLVRFRSKLPLPTEWTPGHYETRMYLFGVLPLGQQTIGITFPAPEPPITFALHDQGRGELAHIWFHRIVIQPLDETQCRYTDTVTVGAGLLTPFVWLFASGLFAWRQRRWRKLARLQTGFQLRES